MARRKRKASVASKKPILQSFKDYRDDEFVPYIFVVERGIVHVWQAIPDLRDGDVRQALRRFIKVAQGLDSSKDEPPDLLAPAFEFGLDNKVGVLCAAMKAGLQDGFKDHGPLILEDMIGVLKQVNYSLGSMTTGMNQQGYLSFVSGFMDELQEESKSSDFMDAFIEQIEKLNPEDL